MKAKTLVIFLVIAALLLLSCACAGLVGAQKVMPAIRATLQATKQAKPSQLPYRPLPSPTLPSSSPSLPSSSQTGDGDISIKTRYPSNIVKGSAFDYTIIVSNHSSAPLEICAINFRGDITSILLPKALVSPPGYNYWVEGGEYQQGAIFDTCSIISTGQSASFVFKMRSHISNTWEGEVGLCMEAPTDEHLEVLDNCAYIPVTVDVP